jgi:hypothetical protein
MNAASAWMRMSGDLDWAFTLLTYLDIDMAFLYFAWLT